MATFSLIDQEWAECGSVGWHAFPDCFSSPCHRSVITHYSGGISVFFSVEKIPPCPITIQVERWKKSLLEVVVEEGTPEVAEQKRFTNGQVQRRHILDTISSIGCGLSSASCGPGFIGQSFVFAKLVSNEF